MAATRPTTSRRPRARSTRTSRPRPLRLVLLGSMLMTTRSKLISYDVRLAAASLAHAAISPPPPSPSRSQSASGRLKKLRKTTAESVLSGSTYSERLRAQFEALHPSSSWAEVPASRSDADAADEELLRSAEDVISAKPALLPQGVLDVTRMRNANIVEPNQAVIQALQFHPNGQLLLTAGYDKTIRLFQVDGKKNPKVQSMHLPDMPIQSAYFTASGNEIVATGRRAFFYYYDIQAAQVSRVARILGTHCYARLAWPCLASPGLSSPLLPSLLSSPPLSPSPSPPPPPGRQESHLSHSLPSPDGKYIVVLGRDGTAIFVSQATKQWAFNLKMNGNIRSAAFTGDGSTLYTTGGTVFLVVPAHIHSLMRRPFVLWSPPQRRWRDLHLGRRHAPLHPSLPR